MDEAVAVRRGERVGDLRADAHHLAAATAARARGAPPASRPRATPARGSAAPRAGRCRSSAQMCGWFSAEMVFASRWKRARWAASAASDVGQHLEGDDAIEPRVAGAIHLAHARRPRGGGRWRTARAGCPHRVARCAGSSCTGGDVSSETCLTAVVTQVTCQPHRLAVAAYRRERIDEPNVCLLEVRAIVRRDDQIVGERRGRNEAVLDRHRLAGRAKPGQ